MNWLILSVLLADMPAKSLAVLPFAGRDTDAKDRAALTGTLTAEMRRAAAGLVQWVAPSTLDATLSADRQADLVACTNAGCMARQGAPLHADQLCVGRLDKAGGTWLLHLKLVDTRRAAFIAQADRRLKGTSLAEALEALPTMVDELALKAYPSGWLDITTDPNGLNVTLGTGASGRAPWQLRVPPGPLSLRIDDPCYESKPLQVEAKEGQHTAAALRGIPRLTLLQLHMRDTAGGNAQGEASLDGQPLGPAPGSYTVPVCARELRVVSKSGEVWSTALALTEQRSLDIVVAPPPPKSKTLAYILWGAGAAFIAGGVVADTVPASAHDHKFEFTDVLGPVGYLAGAALGVAGLLQLLD